MKYIVGILLLLSPQVVDAQTVIGAAQNYFLSYYEDSDFNDAEYAVSDLEIPSFQTLSFKIKIKSSRRSVYTDSQGSRFNCSEKRTFTKCSYQANYVDQSDGTNCIESYNYYFTVRRKNRIDAIFQEAYQCDDGWFRVIEYSGRTSAKVKK